MGQVREVITPVVDSITELKVSIAHLQGTMETMAQTKELEHVALNRSDIATNERVAKLETRVDVMEESTTTIKARVDRAYWTLTGVAIGAGTAGGAVGAFLHQTFLTLTEGVG